MRKSVDVSSTSKLKLSELNYGYANLRDIQAYIDDSIQRDLRWPNSLTTYSKMMYDHDVKLGIILTQLFVEKGLKQPVLSCNKSNTKSMEAAEFIKWNLLNMATSFPQAIRDAYSFKQYGFSVLVKNYEQITEGKYSGKFPYKLKSLSPRAQKTLAEDEPFRVVDGHVTHCIQDLSRLNYGFSSVKAKGKVPTQGKAEIPRHKFMLFSYDSTNSNPLGSSPLQSVYRPYREKVLVSDLEVVGAGKDLSGTAVMYAPSEILSRAANDSSSIEAKMIKKLQRDVDNWSAGEQTSMLLPSDLQQGSNSSKEFEVKLLGVEGSGKMYNTSDLISNRQKAILNAFGAGFVLLGQGSTAGSYSIASAQKGVHSFFVEKDINFICEVFNRDLIPQLLKLNNIELDSEDIPKLVSGTVDEANSDEASKAVQRVSSVSMMVQHPELINEILDQLGYKYKIPEEIINDKSKWEEYKEKFITKDSSRAGDGMKSAGTGTSDSVTGEDSDASNLES